MKKLIIFFNIVVFAPLNASTDPQQQVDIWRKNFQQINNPAWEKHSAMQKRQKRLGYNPDITLIEKNHPNVVQQSGPTLPIHGWNGSKDAYSFARHCQSNNVPGDVIMFNFQDASRWIKQTIPYWLPISKSSFAGLHDILALLHVLKTTHDLQCSPAVLYPHSRGAGTTMAVIGILKNPSTTNEKTALKTLGITNEDRTAILTSIKVIYLLNPLTNIDNAINIQLEKRLYYLFYSYWSESTKKKCVSFLKNTALPRLTRYIPDQKNPIDYIQSWKGIESCVWLHFEENDWDVSNKDDVKLAQQLLESLSEEKLYVSRTNNGGHNAYPLLIDRIIHENNKKHGVSHEQNLDDTLSLALTALLPQNKDDKDVETHLEKFSTLIEKQKKLCRPGFWQHRMTQRFKNATLIFLAAYTFLYLNQSQWGIFDYHFFIDAQYTYIW